MRCDDAVLELSSGDGSEALQAHLAGCEACRDAARVLSLAALPPPGPAEQAAMAGLAASTRAAWDREERRAEVRRRRVVRVVSLAVAAGLGALVASGGFLLRGRSGPGAPSGGVEAVELAAADEPESYLQDDEVFFDVSWPEGDTQ